MSTLPSLGYQPALDGLRALSIVAVVLYHVDIQWLPGGFLGVEVFFVVSGYLITALLIEERALNGSISLRRCILCPPVDTRVGHFNELLRDIASPANDGVYFVTGPTEWCNNPNILTSLSYRWDGVHAYKPGANLIFESIARQLLELPITNR